MVQLELKLNKIIHNSDSFSSSCDIRNWKFWIEITRKIGIGGSISNVDRPKLKSRVVYSRDLLQVSECVAAHLLLARALSAHVPFMMWPETAHFAPLPFSPSLEREAANLTFCPDWCQLDKFTVWRARVCLGEMGSEYHVMRRISSACCVVG